MSLLSGVRGVQVPRVNVVPECLNADFADFDDAIQLAADYGLVADEWQENVLRSWMMRDASVDRWASGTCGIAVPRQNGKNGCLEIRELFGMVFLGEKFLHTAHEVRTARKHFKRLASFFDEELGAKPELSSLVTELRYANGQEAIFLKNGGSVEMVARSKGGGRGFTVDVLVLDEAQELADEALEALKPTLASAPRGDRQTIYAGTPPSPKMNGEVFTRTRESALSGAHKRIAWVEWSVDEDDSDVDMRDPEVWAAVNPALGGRLGVDAIEEELEEFSEEGFFRERLGRWEKGLSNAVIAGATWGLAKESEPPTVGLKAFAVDMNPDRSVLTVASARKPDEGPIHVEVVRSESTGSGTAWAVEFIASRWPDTASVVIDGMSPAASLIPELVARKVKVTVTSSSDMMKACGMFYDGILQRSITHFDQPGLNAALAAADRRFGSGGAWSWDRKSLDADITPLVAATLAHWGVSTTKRRPGRKSKVSY